MLEQMGEAGLALRLVLRPDIVPGADRDHRRLAILMDDDGQAIGELEGLVGDGHLPDQRGSRSRPRAEATAGRASAPSEARQGTPAVERNSAWD